MTRKEVGSGVVLCRMGDSEGHGDEITCILMPTKESSLTLSGLEYGVWEEYLETRGRYTVDIPDTN